MQSYRLTRTLPTLPTRTRSIMPCYAAAPRQSHAIRFAPFPVNDLAPLFRLFDETPVSRPIRSFQPRFDVREEKNAFQLNGELPGVKQKDVQIEFVDENTLVIQGKSARESARASKPEAVEATPAAAEKQVEGEKNDDAATSDSDSAFHKASVEDEYVDVQSNAEEAATPATTATETAKPALEQQQPSEKPQQPKAKYWVSERSVGQFKRSFTFPGHVDRDAVTASLKNGILSVVVPKALAPEAKRIVVE